MADDKKPDDRSLYGGKYETFAEWVKAEPDIFDDMDCRPGSSESDEEYLLAVTPQHLRHLVPRILEMRRKRREAEAAVEVDREDGEKIAKAKPKETGRQKVSLPGFFTGTGMPDPGWWEALWPEPARVLEQVEMTHGMTVADLCSGDGWFTLQIARIARSVYAIDIDAKLLDAARTRLGDAGVANCRFIDGDAFEIAKLVPEPVDFVFLANAFHGVPDQPRLARAVRDSLKPSGLFAVVSWHARPREETTVLGEPRGPATELRMTPEATVRALEPSNFKLIKMLDVSPHHYGAVFQRNSSAGSRDEFPRRPSP